MVKIIAHIKGPSGGGKTTIGNIINDKYKYIKNIDTDDVLLQDLKCMFPKNYKKYLIQNNLQLFYKNFFYKGLEKIIKPYKYVILVGDFRINVENELYNLDNVITENKFVIDIDEDLLIRRRFDRHIHFINDHLEKYFQKAKKKPLCIDLDLWKGERMYWGQSREKYYQRANINGYQLLTQNNIIEQLEQIITQMNI